jgi:hypothetical protein
MAWPRCPACKKRAIEAGADPRTVVAPPMTEWLDGAEDLTPAEDRFFRLWGCATCGHRTLTVETEVGPAGTCYPKRSLRVGA